MRNIAKINETLKLSALLGMVCSAFVLNIPSVNAQQTLQPLSVEIGGQGIQHYPITVLGFNGNNPDDLNILNTVIHSDLSKTGLFKLIDSNGIKPPIDINETPDIGLVNADTAVWGNILKTSAGYEVQLRVYDVVRRQILDTVSLGVSSQPRLAGHQIANRIYEVITGHAGFFTNRLAYITQTSPSAFELRVSDWDGQAAVVALRSKEPVMSPTFNQQKTELAYVSFENKKANVYVHQLATGKRQLVANFKGTNSAPAFSPNQSQLALALSREGLAQLYSINLKNNEQPQRLSHSSGIDTEPVYSADGQFIYFVSDRGGQPNIYKMSSQGGEAQRITFKSDYNISPALSPNGQLLAYITRRQGRFMTAVLNLSTGQETLISQGPHDESPNFTSNSQFVIFASQNKGKGVLVLASVDGSVYNTLSLPKANIREPALGF